MLPIAHALADAHKQRRICISRVAGCSAGSICAALVACGADFDKAKDFIINEGPKRALEMRRWSTNFGAKPLGLDLDRVRLAWALREVQKGTSLLDTNVLINFLDELFQASAPSPLPQMQDINGRPASIKLAITGSDLSRGLGETFEQGNVLDRIASSCAIPFAFRTYLDIK